MPLPLMKNPSAPGKFAVALWFAFLTALAGLGAYYRMFTEFSGYDDEGTLMISVKQYLSGAKLYEHGSLPYGPVYYFYNWMVRTISGTTVTHDVVRMSSLIPWLLTALVAAWIVFRFTGSLVLASVTHLLTSRALFDFFHFEPGHPQELCILLLVCLLASGIVSSKPHRRVLGMLLLGVITAALMLVKVNIGTFAFLAVSLAILAHSPVTKFSRLAFASAAAASVILPVALMKSHLKDEGTWMYAALVVVSMSAALLILFRVPRSICFRLKDPWIALCSFAITLTGVIVALKVRGVSANATLHALVLDSLTTYVNRGSWYLPLPSDHRWLPWIVGGLCAALFLSRDAARKVQIENEQLYLKLALAVLTVLALFSGKLLLWLVLPYCWLVLYGDGGSRDSSNTFLRTLLCVVAVLQSLYAYPIAGSQRFFILVLPIIVVMTYWGDLMSWQQERLSAIPPMLSRAATSMILICVAAFYLAIDLNARADYDSMPSLQLSGAERIHVPLPQALDYRWLVQNLDDHCDIFVGFPELPSLHVWTGKDPLPGMEIDDWMLTASNEQQTAAAAILSEHPNACAFYSPVLTNIWNPTHRNLDSLPLVHYLHDNFKVVGARGQFYFLVRDGRDLDIASSGVKTPFDPSAVNKLWKSRSVLK
jgi:hypothetical protein